MKNKQVLRWLIGVVSLVGLFLLTMVATPVKAAAANFNANDYLTSAQVTNGPDFKPADTIDVQYKLDFGSQQLNNGDTITLDLPSNLKAKSVGETFDVLDADTGAVIGVAKITTDGQVVITVNDALEGKTNDKMVLNIGTRYRGDDYGEKDVNFNDDNQSIINIVDNDANLSKKGTLQSDGTIKWTILVNRREAEMANLKINDTIGANQTMIEGLTVSNGEWSSNSSYKRRDEISASDYTVNYTDDGFDLAFKNTVSNLVVIDYYTKVTDETLIDSGYKFRNKAIMSWGGGTSGGSNSEEANGSVSSSNGNNGAGTGDKDTDIDTDDGDTGTTDTDGGTDETVEPIPEPGTDSSSSSSSQSSSSSSSSVTQNSSTSSATVTSPATDSSSTTGTTGANKVSSTPAATKSATAAKQTLPQTNESATDGQALVAIGALVATLTLGGAALLRHWF